MRACEQPTRSYQRRDPGVCPVNAVVRRHLESFLLRAQHAGRTVPRFVERELRGFVRCGVLAHGFLRVYCPACRSNRLVAFSCKGRGLCPSCGGRRMAETAAHLVDRVLPQVGVRQWVLSFPFELRRRLGYEPQLLSEVLAVVIRAIFGFVRERVRERAGPVDARDIHRGAVTFIQRFGSSLNLNPHLHMVLLDGAYVTRDGLVKRFVAIPPPTTEEVAEVVKTIRHRVVRMLVRRGILDEQGHLAESGGEDDDDDESVLPLLSAASVQGVSAVGPEAGRRLTRPGRSRAEPYVEAELGPRCVAFGGFSLHADVALHGRDRRGLEHLCRYVARPPVARERLRLLPDGRVYYAFKRAWRDGSRGIVMSGEDFIGRVAALIPRPQANLVRYHGCFAPGSRIRGTVVRDRRPARRPERNDAIGETAKVMNEAVESAAGNVVGIRDRNYPWHELMKRVFDLDVLLCSGCGGRMKVVAEIDDPILARKILEHLGLPADELALEPARGPPPEWADEPDEPPPVTEDEWI